jgi:hypothetical protein
MATRSTIAVIHEDGTVSQIYCHWDGYLQHNGQILVEHYNTRLAAEFLVSKGDLSVLAPRVTPDRNAIHNFKVQQNGVCVFYGRDRGETDVEPKRFADVYEYLDGILSEEYNYLFNGTSWGYQSHGMTEFVEVTTELVKEAEGCE